MRANLSPASLVGSAVLTARLRASRMATGLASCDGRLPVLHAGGAVTIGARFAVRGRVARAEIGARSGGRLVIGDRVFVNQGASIVATLHIEMGDDVRIGDFVAIYDSDHHPLDATMPVNVAPVVIGRGAWLARSCIVLPGVTIGEHAVVAAGAIVTGDVAARTLVAGNPARQIQTLDVPNGWRRP